jgi:hypothetical protein
MRKTRIGFKVRLGIVIAIGGILGTGIGILITKLSEMV